jgi:hypothetical protein
MSREIEKLPRLIEQAIASLEKATTAAEVLEAKEQASLAYDAARIAVRFAKAKKAHDTVIAACHRAQADALVIEARAQCRLADEYDAAQARGDVQSAGGNRRSTIIPNENNGPTVTDIGLTSKQVHEARKMRDAEKADPGMIRKIVNAKLEVGQEPTRADVKRAVQPDRGKPKSAPRQGAAALDKARKIVRDKIAAGKPIDREKLAREHGVALGTIATAATAEKARKDALEEKTALDPSMLGKTAQERLETAIRVHKKKLDMEFEQRVRIECRRWLEDVSLPHYLKKLEHLERVIYNRKGIMDRATYRKILSCLHPDRVHDEHKKRYEEAFTLFTDLEKVVLNEKDSPTQFMNWPKTYDDLMKMREQATAERRAKRAAPKSALV